jgi:hypothetical protein
MVLFIYFESFSYCHQQIAAMKEIETVMNREMGKDSKLVVIS